MVRYSKHRLIITHNNWSVVYDFLFTLHCVGVIEDAPRSFCIRVDHRGEVPAQVIDSLD